MRHKNSVMEMIQKRLSGVDGEPSQVEFVSLRPLSCVSINKANYPCHTCSLSANINQLFQGKQSFLTPSFSEGAAEECFHANDPVDYAPLL